MAKFPLVLNDGVTVRNLKKLQANFDLEKIMAYFANGKLAEWLEDRYFDEKAEAVRKLTQDTPQLPKKLCQILEVPYDEDVVDSLKQMDDIDTIAKRNEHLNILKQHTGDKSVWEHVDDMAFNQEELDVLVKTEVEKIYLYQKEKEPFIIPASVPNKIYVKINEVSVLVRFDDINDLKKIGIALVDLQQATSGVELNTADELKKDEDNLENSKTYYTDDSFESVQNLADYADDPNAWLELGIRYYTGKKLKNESQNYMKARECFERAAGLENAEAMWLLGRMYFWGEGIDSDKKRATYWGKKAAQKGHRDAINFMKNQGYSFL